MGVAVTHVTVSWINSKGTTFALSQKPLSVSLFVFAVRVKTCRISAPLNSIVLAAFFLSKLFLQLI